MHNNNFKVLKILFDLTALSEKGYINTLILTHTFLNL